MEPWVRGSLVSRRIWKPTEPLVISGSSPRSSDTLAATEIALILLGCVQTTCVAEPHPLAIASSNINWGIYNNAIKILIYAYMWKTAKNSIINENKKSTYNNINVLFWKFIPTIKIFKFMYKRKIWSYFNYPHSTADHLR